MKIVKMGLVALMASFCFVTTTAPTVEAKGAAKAATAKAPKGGGKKGGKKTTAKAEAKAPEAKSETKPEPKSEPKPETKPEPKSEPKTEAAKTETPKIDPPTPSKEPAASTTANPLPIDCSAPGTKDQRCNRPSSSFAGTIGNGQKIMGTTGFPHVGEGFVEGNRLIVAVEMGSQMDEQGGIFSIDLTTGDRTLVSGKIEDPAKGPVTIGAGPDLGNIRAVAQAGSSWVALVAKGNNDAVIVRIDPKTGNRTLEAKLDNIKCTGTTVKLNANVLGGIAGAPDGTAFVSAGNAQRTVTLLSYAKGDACSVVTTSGNGGFEAKGSGPTIDSLDPYKALRYDNGKVWALHGISNSLMTIDVATGNRARISSGEVSVRVGNGDAKLGSNTLLLASGGTRVWTAGAWAGRDFVLTEVNTATGERIAHIAKSGPASRDANNGVWMHPSKPLLVLAIDNAIALYDPVTGNSSLLSH